MFVCLFNVFLCIWLHWVLVAVVRIFIHLTSDETGPLHWEHGVSAREIPGARVFREVIKFKRGHGVKPLKEERGIRELPLPSENAGRKDRDMKTQRTAVYKAVVSLDLTQPSNLRNCEKTGLLFTAPSLVLCHGSWSRLVNTSVIERSTYTNLEKVTAGSFSSENPELSWSSSSSGEN